MEIFAWPAALVILSIVGMFIFRSPLSGLIGRIRSANREGISFDHAQERREIEAPPLHPIEALTQQPRTTTVIERERLIQNQLPEFHCRSDSDKISLLILALANSQIAREFDNAANIIFASQQGFLNHLAGSPGGVPRSVAEAYFHNAQRAFPKIHANTTVDDWLKFISINGLIEQKSTNIHLTQRGADFLKYLIDARLLYERYG